MHRIGFLTFIGLGLCSGVLQGAPFLKVDAASGPAPTSGHFPEFGQLATADMPSGDPHNYPGAYAPLNGFVEPGALIASSKQSEKSWWGSTDLTTQTANENGTYLWFRYDFRVGDGEDPFLLSSGKLKITSTDTIFNLTDSFADDVFSNYTRGVNAGADGILGTSDDLIVESGSDTPVHAVSSLVGGIASDASAIENGTLPERLDLLFGYLNSRAGDEITAEITYDLGDRGIVSASNTLTIVPEPSSLGLLALGGCALLKRRRK